MDYGREEGEWNGKRSQRIEDIGRLMSLDKISLPSEVRQNKNTTDVNSTENKVPSEAKGDTDASAIRSSYPALQERSQLEENNVLADGNKNGQLTTLLLSSKELPSWAMRQTVLVPPNTSSIAECQGCIKENGTPHTCDMKEEVPLQFSDMPSDICPVPSNRHSSIQPMIMNPHTPAWPEGHEVCLPSCRHPPLPSRRQDQHSYHDHRSYDRHYCEQCEDEDYMCYPLETYGRHCTHEVTRGPQPHDAYSRHVNHSHSYSAMHDPAFLRFRHVEEHPPPPPPSHFHQYSASKYPYVPLPGQILTGSEHQSRFLQNCSKYEPMQVCTDVFVDRMNSRGDWLQPEVEPSTVTYNAAPHSKESSFSLSLLSANKIQSESHSGKLENHQQLLQTHSLAGDFTSKAGAASETKTSSEELAVVSSVENTINFPEKNSPAPPADDLKPLTISSSDSSNNNKDMPSNNDFCDSYPTTSEAVKFKEVLSVRNSSADSTIAADVENQKTPSLYGRKSPCAFTIDISSVTSLPADSFSAPKLPANLARRMTKFPRKLATKDDKSEKTSQTNSTFTRRKKNSSLRSSRKLADDKNKQSLKFKDLQHVSSDNDDDDYDDKSPETFQVERLQWSKPLLWTKVEIIPLRNDHYFKSSGPELQGTSVTTNLSKAKPKMHSDDSQHEKMNNSHGARFSSEFERTSVQKDIPSTSTRKYASLHKFYNDTEQMSHKGSFQSGYDSEVSETDTYTIRAAEPDSAVLAARAKIDELFRVGIKELQSETENQVRDDDLPSKSFKKEFISAQKGDVEHEGILENNHSRQIEGSIEKDKSIELTTAVVCQRKPDYVSQKNQEDSCLNVQDSDDVICLTHDLNKDSIHDRRSKNDTETSSVPTSPVRNTSSNKRLLPRVPGKDDPADCAALVFEPAATRSFAGNSDKGFFEVLSSDAPEMRLAEKKKVVRRFELNSCITETPQKPHTDREFEVIADVPRVARVAEDVGMNKEKSQNDALDFLQENKVLRKSLNKKGPSSSSQAAEDEFKKIPFDAPRSGRLTGTASNERECVRDRKPPLHSRAGKLCSLPIFDETVLPDEMKLNHSQRNLVGVSVTSKNRTTFDRTNNKEGPTSTNEGFVPITSGRSSGRPEGRRLPGSPTKPINSTNSEFISRGRPGSGGKGSLREANHEIGIDLNITGSLSQHSTPRLTSRLSSTQSHRLTENTLGSRPPLSGCRQRTPVSKTVSQGYAIVSEPGTPSRTTQVRQRSLSRPPSCRDDPHRSLSRTSLSRDDPTRQQHKFQKHTSSDSSNMTEAMLLSQSKGRQAFRGRRLGETPKLEQNSSFDSEARMKRSKSASFGLRSRTSDAENPKLQAYHERMKYDPKKAIQESKKHNRLSASSRSDDTDASSYEELQNHHFTRHRPGSMSYSGSQSKKTSNFQSRSSFKSGGRPRSDRTRMPLDEGLNHSTSSDVETLQTNEAYGVQFTTIPSIQNLSEDIQQILKKITHDKTRTSSSTKVTGLSANRATSSVNDPQLNELCKTLKKVKQVLESKFHS